ncbi:MAG: ABC transporter ATP-binding protein [Eubacterium sp.]|nr:ABC transporter ATP-binding protein [Eubacterium sp.]
MAAEREKEIHIGKPKTRSLKPTVENPMELFRRIMASIMKKYTVLVIIVVICIAMSVFCNVQGTMFLKSLIDVYVTPLIGKANPDFSPLASAILRVAVFYAIGVGCSFVQSRLMVYISQGTLRNLREDLFLNMERLPIRYFDEHSRGDIMSVYTNDIDTLRQMISQSLPQILNSAITIVSVLIMMILLSVPLTLVTVGMVVLMLFLSMKATKIAGKNYVRQQKNIGKTNGYIEEIMTGEKVVKVFSREKICIEQFDRYNEELYQSAYKATAFANIVGPISAQLGNASYVLCAFIGGLLVLNPVLGFTVGGLASFLTFNKNFSMPINQVTMQLASIMQALAGADRLFKLMDEKPDPDSGTVTLVNTKEENNRIVECKEHTGTWAWKLPADKVGQRDPYVPLKGSVVFEHVDFEYKTDQQILYDISLFAKPGQKIALVGSTGAGKTTITNLLNRFYEIKDGKIYYDGIKISDIHKPDLRRSLGIVLQETHLFTGTVMDNIRYGRLDATDEEVKAAARLANADSFIRHLPNGYNTILSGDGGNLSQGQRQLLSIARAAIADPPVLILDEATSSIDTRTERIVQAGMDKLMEGRTTFVIAHRLSTIRNSDCIMVMEKGRIIERGSHETLMQEKGRYYNLYTGGSIAS